MVRSRASTLDVVQVGATSKPRICRDVQDNQSSLAAESAPSETSRSNKREPAKRDHEGFLLGILFMRPAQAFHCLDSEASVNHLIILCRTPSGISLPSLPECVCKPSTGRRFAAVVR
jgi:hypothetical protein